MISAAAALLVAAPMFPRWEKVTPETMMRPVPEYVVTQDVPGSIRRYPKSQSLPERCAVIEAGKVVGYHLSCE